MHTPTTNEVISDISGIAIKWPEETRAKVFAAINAHEGLIEIAKQIIADYKSWESESDIVSFGERMDANVTDLQEALTKAGVKL